MQLVKITPSTIILQTNRTKGYQELYRDRLDKLIGHDEIKRLKELKRIKKLSNLQLAKSSFNLSPASSRLLRHSVSSMILMSSARTVNIDKTKKIYNFKGAFITLTLPAVQFHDDVTIKAAFSRFLTSLRNTLNLKNYVWRMELQKNGNIHFHLVIDKYYTYNMIKYYWNVELKKLGYIARYAAKFSCMDLHAYAKARCKKPFEVLKAYQDGCKSSWQSPNTVSVNSVTSSKQLGAYLAKYMVKPVIESDEESEKDKLRASLVGKLWARSQSLSSLPPLVNFVLDDIIELIRSWDGLSDIKLMRFDFCTLYYLRFKSIKSLFYIGWRRIFVRHARAYGYIVPT